MEVTGKLLLAMLRPNMILEYSHCGYVVIHI